MQHTSTPDPDRPPRIRITASIETYLAVMRRGWTRPIVEDPARDDDRA